MLHTGSSIRTIALHRFSVISDQKGVFFTNASLKAESLPIYMCLQHSLAVLEPVEDQPFFSKKNGTGHFRSLPRFFHSKPRNHSFAPPFISARLFYAPYLKRRFTWLFYHTSSPTRLSSHLITAPPRPALSLLIISLYASLCPSLPPLYPTTAPRSRHGSQPHPRR